MIDLRFRNSLGIFIIVASGCTSNLRAPELSESPTWKRISIPTAADFETTFFLDNLQGWALGSTGIVVGTVDGGQTWELLSDKHLNGGRESFRCEHLIFKDTLRGRIGVCCGECALAGNILMATWDTVDGGRTWTRSEAARPEPRNLIEPVFFDTVLSERWSRSHDGGVCVGKTGRQPRGITALQSSRGTTGSFDSSGLADVWFSSPSTGCVAGADVLGGVVLRTDDGGATWARKGTDRLRGQSLSQVRMVSDDRIIVSGGNQIYGSSDGGETWTEEWTGESEERDVSLLFVGSKIGIAVGRRGLILRCSP